MKPRPTSSTRRPARPAVLRMEQLEAREVPATLVAANKVTYQDLDGDNVTETFSKAAPRICRDD